MAGRQATDTEPRSRRVTFGCELGKQALPSPLAEWGESDTALVSLADGEGSRYSCL